MLIATEWTYKYNYVPERKRSYFIIERNGMNVDCRVMGWLDANLEPTTKSKARYIDARRFSYQNKGRDGLPTIFAIALP